MSNAVTSVCGLLAVALVCATCAYENYLDVRAPIVETCVQHPSTVGIVCQ